MARPASGLEAHLGYWLRYVSNHVSFGFARKLAGRDVTVAEWVILRDLYGAGAIAPSEVAGRLGLTRGAVSKLVDRLVGKSLISRRTDAADKRAQKLTLTAHGRALVPTLAALADENDAEFFGHLSVAERGELARMLRDIVARHGLKAVPIE